MVIFKFSLLFACIISVEFNLKTMSNYEWDFYNFNRYVQAQ